MTSARTETHAAEQRRSIPTDIYSEQAVWLCRNLALGHTTRINGVLAQVLKKYPAAYHLRLLAPEGACDVDIT